MNNYDNQDHYDNQKYIWYSSKNLDLKNKIQWSTSPDNVGFSRLFCTLLITPLNSSYPKFYDNLSFLSLVCPLAHNLFYGTYFVTTVNGER